MPDRYSFTSPFGQGSDPWFKIKNLDVTTTVAVTLASIAGIFWWAFEPGNKTWFSKLYLEPDAVLQGQIWQILTWPLANALGQRAFSTVIAIVIFYFLGSQLERVFGKKDYLLFILLLTIIPAIIVVAAASLTSIAFIGLGSIEFLELGIFIGFIAHKPKAPFFFGIPAWILGAVFVGVNLLQAIGRNQTDEIILLLTVVIAAIVLIRSFDHAAPELSWVPAFPLKNVGSKQNKRKKRKQDRHLYSVSSVEDELELNALLDKVSSAGFENLSRSEQRRLKALSKKKDQ